MMQAILTVEQVRAAEQAANAAGLSYAEMMQRAGAAVASYLFAFEPNAVLLVLVGSGNNGGDGLVAATEFRRLKPDALVRAYLLKERDNPLSAAAKQSGIEMICAADDEGYQTLHRWLDECDILLDALLGIGVTLPLRQDVRNLLVAVKAALNIPPTRDVLYSELVNVNHSYWDYPRNLIAVVAVDCPSGFDCDSGEVDPDCLPAHATMTFIGMKPGLLKGAGLKVSGDLLVAGLGVLETLGTPPPKTAIIESEDMYVRLPPRPVDSNKGTFGKALIVAGSRSYTGAAGLAAGAAYRSGTGLVTIGAIAEVRAALAGAIMEATWLVLPESDGHLAARAEVEVRQAAERYDALLIGCGLGVSNATRGLIGALLSEERLQTKLVLDADALNIAAEMPRWWQHLPTETVITPHPGEMARLCQSDTQTVQANRWELARQKAAEWGVVVVLKGAHTVIAAPDGRLAISPFKTSALAKAGTGDMLAGLLVGLMAQGLTAFDAAVCAVHMHGLVARAKMNRSVAASLTATDMLADQHIWHTFQRR